jgi:hypothetical protein
VAAKSRKVTKLKVGKSMLRGIPKNQKSDD